MDSTNYQTALAVNSLLDTIKEHTRTDISLDSQSRKTLKKIHSELTKIEDHEVDLHQIELFKEIIYSLLDKT